MAVQHVVTGPLAIATTTAGYQVYVYQGRALPDEVSAEEAARLVKTGLVERVEVAPVESADEGDEGDDPVVDDDTAKPKTPTRRKA